METSWYCLPGEVRNRVYEWCLLLEDDRNQSVRHFPHGFRRCRSKQKNGADANFPTSYWGFTQTCKQIRAEFTPWLLERRHVKTPLATLNEYLDVFHPVNPETRRRTGSIEPTRPKYSRVPIPICGIEILDLLKRNHFDQNFRLELRAEYSMISTYKRDELDILYRLSQNVDWSSELHRSCGIVSIVLLPYEVNTWNSHVVVPHFVTRPSFKHKSMVRLTCEPTHTADGRSRTSQEQRWCVVNWLFNESQLVYYQDLWIHVIINGFETMWRVNMPGFVIGQWEKFADGRSIVREHWLLRVTMLSAEGSIVSTIKELPSR